MLRAHDVPTDYCSCIKEPGEWGQGGWHWMLQNEAYCVKWADGRYRERYGERVKRDDEKWRGLYEMVARYLGRPLATVQCPLYQAAAEREANKDRARTSVAGSNLV